MHLFEDHLLRGPRECAAILGMSYSNYQAMKQGTRPIPRYVDYHVEAIMSLSGDALLALVKRRLEGDK